MKTVCPHPTPTWNTKGIPKSRKAKMRTKILLAFVVLSCTLLTAFALSSSASVIRGASRARAATATASARAKDPLNPSVALNGEGGASIFPDLPSPLNILGIARADAARGKKAPAQDANRGIWLELRMCESGDNYRTDTGNGYYGAYQFLPSTWQSIGFAGMPNDAPVDVQNSAARIVEALYGWSAWPQCAAELGLR
jgi:hypothetical protein